MRAVLICLMLSVLSFGCNPAEVARRRSAERNLRQLEAALRNYEEKQAALLADSWRVLVTETEYYLDGPQQGRPPDGSFAAGAKVQVIDDAGSYVLVRTETGLEAHISAEALDFGKPSPNTETLP